MSSFWNSLLSDCPFKRSKLTQFCCVPPSTSGNVQEIAIGTMFNRQSKPSPETANLFPLKLAALLLDKLLLLLLLFVSDRISGVSAQTIADFKEVTTSGPREMNYNHTRERVIQDLVSRHDAKIPPNYEDNFPTNVDVQIFIVSFDSISESTMDFSLTIFLRQTWNDSRLAYRPLPGIQALELDARIMHKIWVPDLFFTNEKEASFHDVTVPNRLMNIYPHGQVLYSARISMKLSCDMDLVKFPFDSQTCYINLESYSYSTENVIFRWNTDPVQKRADMSLPQFELKEFDTKDCTVFYIAANYTCIRVEFSLVRQYGYYMAQVYIPSMLVVILSWVSFWLDIDAVPARISLGLLTVLTMTTQSASARSNLPRVSYVKALDVWMAMCLIFVFAALIEFAYVNVNARVERRRQTVHGGLKLGAGSGSTASTAPSTASAASMGGARGGGGGESADEKNGGKRRLFSKTTVMRQRARRLDKIARIAFPAVFVLFNVVYWILYMVF